MCWLQIYTCWTYAVPEARDGDRVGLPLLLPATDDEMETFGRACKNVAGWPAWQGCVCKGLALRNEDPIHLDYK
jgi:hypothetical protein